MQFITFEGGEGSGKSTQLSMLYDYLHNLQVKSIATKEPGGTNLGSQIREILLRNDGIDDSKAEFALLTAARREHVLKVIQPALDKGIVVLCDRYIDSSLAYQGLHKGLDIDVILDVHMKLVGGLMPHLTFVLDIEPEIAMHRVATNKREVNHYDLREMAFHHEIRQNFLHLAAKFNQRIVVLDASRDVHAVAKLVQSAIKNIVRLQSCQHAVLLILGAPINHQDIDSL